MLLATGRIVAVTGDGEALIDVPRHHSCAGCSARAGCGHALLAAVASTPSQRVNARFARQQNDLRTGDLVEVALPDGVLLEGASQAWLWPLCLMTGGLLAGSSVGDGGAAAGALVGLLGGWLALRHYHRKRADRFLPSIVGPAAPSALRRCPPAP